MRLKSVFFGRSANEYQGDVEPGLGAVVRNEEVRPGSSDRGDEEHEAGVTGVRHLRLRQYHLGGHRGRAPDQREG